MTHSTSFAFFTAAPGAPLDAFVESIWSVRGDAPYRRAAVLPNGALQLMVSFRATHRLTAFGARAVDRRYERAWIAGLQETPITIEAPARTHLLAIRFRPGGAHAFLPLPVDELTNDVVHAGDVLGAATEELRERIALAPAWCDQVHAAQDWLLAHLRPRERDYALVTRAITALQAPAPRATVRATCAQLGLSNKHLIDVFRATTGLTPKTLARIQRFHRALRRLAAGADADRAALALDLGYADQSHFNNDFKRLAGVAPTVFVARRGADAESLILG